MSPDSQDAIEYRKQCLRNNIERLRQELDRCTHELLRLDDKEHVPSRASP